ncbi:hypothetical protein [Pseudomonas oryzihabitans]|uniref:hypothetical protein n=1 Tax=Pseudomonas oryzihabitans TaxID=47885 RepID=UPI002898D2D7|nr:hypothetical protein [Pseudomonas oryzihabitans]
MAIVIPQEDQPLSKECRELLYEIRKLQDKVDRVSRDTTADFLSSIGSPKPGTFFGPGRYGDAPIKRVLVDGVEVKDVEYADTERGFIIFAVSPLQVRPGTDEIWRDIKGGKVTIEYEGDEPAAELAEDGQLIVMRVNAGTAGRPVNEIAEAFGADEYGTARCNTSLEAVINAAACIHYHQVTETAERALLDRVESKQP